MGSFTLNFNKERLITAANIVDNVLYFTDNENEPKRINLEVFKTADHSNGTTSVYGRQFLERDITVIRPHPQQVINSNLSHEIDVPIDAGEPSVITGEADVFDNFVKLNGLAVNAGTVFTKRGFYYFEYVSGSAPTLETVISGGTQAEADLDGSSFSSDVVLDADKKYYYVAYAKTQVGVASYGDILAVTTAALTFDFPSVKTVGHEKITNLSYKLKGSVTDEGGSPVREVGIYYYFLDLLTTSNIPTTLVGDFNNPITNARKKTATYNNDTGEFYVNISIEPGKIFYYQAYAINVESGQAEGLLKNQIVSVTEKPVLELRDCEIFNDKAILRARVTNPHGNLTERGFYFSKTSNNLFTMIATHATDPNIFKVSVPMNANTALDTYIYDTISETNLTLAAGDTLYAAAYASNGAENQTGIIPLNILKTEGDPPSIATESLTIVDNSGNSRLRCVGNNQTPLDQSIQKLGFYITRTPVGDKLGIDQNAKKAEMVRRFNASPQTATEIVSQKTIGFLTQPNTDIGLFADTFDGDGIVDLEPGFDYHAMAIGTNAHGLGKGDVITVTTKTESDGPSVITNLTTDETLTSGTMRGTVKFDSDPAAKVAIEDAGFTYAAGESGSLKVAHISISSGDLTTLNTFITTGAGTGRFNVTKTGLTSNTLYKVQAFIQIDGVKIYAKYENDIQGTYGDSITRFRTLKTTVDLATITATRTSSNTSKTQGVRGNLLSDGGSDMTLLSMRPVFYYSTKATTVGSTDAQRIADIKSRVGSNSPTATLGKIGGNFNFEDAADSSHPATETYALLGGVQDNVLGSTATPLLEDTAYYFFMSTTVSNGAGTSDSDLNDFITAKKNVAPIINPVVITEIGETHVWASAKIMNKESNQVYFGKLMGFYYVKKTDMAADYDPSNGLTAATSIVANSNKVFVATTTKTVLGSKKIESLEIDTEYYIIAALENNTGTGYSATATLFETKRDTTSDSIVLQDYKFVWFNGKGLPKLSAGSQQFIPFVTTPSNATVNVENDGFWTPNTGGADPIIFVEKDSSGGGILTISCPQNNSGAYRETNINLIHSMNPGVRKRIKILQEAKVGGPIDSPFDDGFGSDDGPDLSEAL